MLNAIFLAEEAAVDPGTVPPWFANPIVLMVVMFAVFYFLLIRPQQKKTKARNAMLQSLKKGDKVTTIGGIHGTVTELTDDIVVLKVSDSGKLTFERSAVNSIESSPAEAKAAE